MPDVETIWFWLLAFSLTAYVVLDGYDFGAGILHLWAARGESERAMVLRTIAPVWDGNEVWLLASGGTMFLAFPGLYASAFSGFYLPLMMVLWLLIGRACAIELRHQLESPPWRAFWDVAFAGSSLLLALFFGVALGNVVRGVPLDPEGGFFEPLWTDFLPRGKTGILDLYTVLVGLSAVAALALQGAVWLAWRTEGAVRERSRRAVVGAAIAVGVLLVATTAATGAVQPHALRRLFSAPWGWVLPAAAVLNLAVAVRSSRLGKDALAFAASSAFLGSMLVTVAFSLYPFVLPATSDPDLALTIWSTASAKSGLRQALWWWIPGMLLATGYTVWSHRRFSDRLKPGAD